jgi:metallo-beta-lactamase class B
MTLKTAAVLALALLLPAQKTAVVNPDPPIVCDSCDAWNAAREPFKVFGNTYFVGTAGLGSVLITSDAGHILLDGGLPQSASVIDAHIRALGFRTADVRVIVNSHAHFDHAGGIHALQRASGATVAASAAGAKALQQGVATADDPQARFADRYPAVANVRVVKDGEALRVGSLEITAHLTPGHTPGATAWTWRSCEGQRCLNVVYADSLNAVSDDVFRFTGDATHPSIVESFRRSISTVEKLPCDILLSVHPDFSHLDEKLKRRAAGEVDALIDPQGCRSYAADATRGLDRRIAAEQK